MSSGPCASPQRDLSAGAGFGDVAESVGSRIAEALGVRGGADAEKIKDCNDRSQLKPFRMLPRHPCFLLCVGIVPRKPGLVHAHRRLLTPAFMSENPSELIERAAAAVRARLGELFPKTAIVLGSGLGRFADKLAHAKSMSYADIPGFSRSTVRGHHGSLMVGDIGGAPLAIMAGRIHAYEGHPAQAIAAPIRTLRKLGVERLVLTNASGGLKADMPAGTLMIVTDHINFSGINPLIGPNDESIGPRFPDMSNAYDPKLRAMLADAAREAGVAVRSR